MRLTISIEDAEKEDFEFGRLVAYLCFSKPTVLIWKTLTKL